MSENNITQIITDKTVGMEQLASFDSRGVAGPGVTPKIAFAEVKRLTLALKKAAERIECLTAELQIKQKHCELDHSATKTNFNAAGECIGCGYKSRRLQKRISDE